MLIHLSHAVCHELSVCGELFITNYLSHRSLKLMNISEGQVFLALVIALIPGILALRLSTELYK